MNGAYALAVPAVTVITVLLAVLMQYEVLNWLYRWLPRFGDRRRPRMIMMMLVILVMHLVAIGLFGTVYWLALDHPSLGAMPGAALQGWLDCTYFSATTYTTAGYGDIVVTGPLRTLAGTEAVAGFVMLTWSASFTINEMRREWKD